jgi:polysaccharide deacetylase family protein (PEP-CTERM system associated)
MRPPPANAPPIVNAMTVDVEDYFQVSAFDAVVSRGSWEQRESRVCANTERLLAMFDECGVRATFFVLGWVADRFPALIRRIGELGHELASHGYHHRLVYDLTPAEFREDVRRAKSVLEAMSGRAVAGYRAPSYSVTERSLWALDVLIEEGHVYDASIFPIHHDRYGIPDAPRHAHVRERAAGAIIEAPGSTVRCGGVNLPVAGGGYFRLLPYGWTRWGIQRLNTVERRPAIFYVHPWEIDPSQPRIAAAGTLQRLRHYRNLGKTEARLRTMMRDFSFSTMDDVLRSWDGFKAATAPALSGKALETTAEAVARRATWA